MTETTAARAEEQPHPFNPDLPKLFANFTEWWNEIPEDEKEDVTPIFEFYMLVDGEPYPGLPGNVYIRGFHTITYGHLLELVRRDAYAEKTRLQLAEACATLRQQRDDALQRLDAVRAVEIHGGEFIDAAELYRALGEPMPDRPDIDHAANIRAKAETTTESVQERQTPDVWCVRYGVEIRDPDGWRMPGPSWDTAITLAEFQRRFRKSTARPVGPQTLSQIDSQMSADVRSER